MICAAVPLEVHMRAMLIAILLLVPRCGSAPLFAQTANQSKPNDEVASSLADMERQWAEVCATHDTSVLGTDDGRSGAGNCSAARTCTERSSMRGIGISAGRLGL